MLSHSPPPPSLGEEYLISTPTELRDVKVWWALVAQEGEGLGHLARRAVVQTAASREQEDVVTELEAPGAGLVNHHYHGDTSPG